MVAEFIAEEGALKGLVLSLETGEEWIIGRDPDLCTIAIEDPKASRQHLRVRKTAEGYVAENLSETNPILINDQPISLPKLLHEGDRVKIGETLFHFYPERKVTGFGFEFEPEEEFTEEESITPEEEEAPPEEEKPPTEEEEKPPIEEEMKSPEEEVPLVEEEIFEEQAPSPEEEGIFEEAEAPEFKVDLTQVTRFILKVIAGPNTGAEFALDLGRTYLIGTDTTSCDVVFNDLSVSREHARLTVSKEGEVAIEDLESRNGVIVDKERIAESKTLTPNAVVALGTSVFLLIDREAPSETIAAPIFEVPEEEVPEEEGVAAAEVIAEKIPSKPFISAGTVVLTLVIVGFAVLLGIGLVSLFETREVETVHKDHVAEIQAIIKDYPGVRFTYNKSSGHLFLIGHVSNGVEHNELLYKIQGLGFIKGVDDNIVNDEAVWQEMNILLSKHTDFKGVSMHSPEPGVFVLSGYLQTEKQAADLMDYLNVNFNYLNLLQNRVVVEQSVVEEVNSQLMQHGYRAVNATFTNGELQLTGYIGSTQAYEFGNLVLAFKKIPGVRVVKNFVVTVTPEQSVIDLNQKYPDRFHVTGYSKHCDVNINVVINGKILRRGESINGYTITSIQPKTIFLEKDGLKYKIEYNK